MTGRIADHEVVVRDTGEALFPPSHFFRMIRMLTWVGFWLLVGAVAGVVAHSMGGNGTKAFMGGYLMSLSPTLALPFRARAIDKHHALLAPRLSTRYGVEVTIVDLYNFQHRGETGGGDHTHLAADSRFTLSHVTHPEVGKNAPYTLGLGTPVWWETPEPSTEDGAAHGSSLGVERSI